MSRRKGGKERYVLDEQFLRKASTRVRYAHHEESVQYRGQIEALHNCSRAYGDAKHQGLTIEGVPRVVLVIKPTKIHVAILHDEVVVAQAEHIILVNFARFLVWIYWHQSNPLPFLILVP